MSKHMETDTETTHNIFEGHEETVDTEERNQKVVKNAAPRIIFIKNDGTRETLDTSSSSLPQTDGATNSRTQDNVQRIINNDYRWSDYSTKVLIKLYRKYKDTPRKKELFGLIAQDLNNEYNCCVTRENCENRWRVIQRNYRKFYNGKTQKHFPYLQECDELFGRKRNVRPAILLRTGNNTKIVPLKHQLITPNFLKQTSGIKTNQETAPDSLCVKCTETEDIKEQILKYQKEKLDLKKTQLQIDRARLNEAKKKNDIMQKRNELLEKFLKNKINMPLDM